MPPLPVVRIEAVHKSFRATKAVEDLSLEIPRGSTTGFLGPNGAGKSTTIRMVMSILRPDAGRIEVLGGDAWDRKDAIGYLPEERGVYRKMQVTEFIALMARLKGMPSGGLRDRIEAWLERVELPHVARMRCDDLSKGMQQKIQFVAALIHEPELVILDEPFSGLDPVNADVLRRVVEALRAEGRTILFSTHVLPQAEQLCDRFVLIDRGRKLLDATLDEIRARFDPRTVQVEYLTSADPSEIGGIESASGEGPQWELLLRSDADPQQVVRDAAALAPVRRVELRRVTLEEVFRRLVRGAR